MRGARRWIWWLVLLITLGSRAAWANPRVLVLLDRRDDEIGQHLEAELETLGLEAMLRRSPDGDAGDHRLLADLAREHDAVAAMRFAPSQRGIAVWLIDRVTGKTLLREVKLSPEDSSEVIALRALELLRASLLELNSTQPPPGEVSPPPAVVAMVAPTTSGPAPAAPLAPLVPPPVALRVGPAVAWSPGGVSPTAHALIGVRWRELRGVGVEGFVALPVRSGRVTGPEGEAKIDAMILGAGFRLASSLGPVEVSAGGGGGYARLTMVGQAQPRFLALSDTTSSLLLYASAGIGVRPTPRLAISLDTTIALNTPGHTILFAGRPAATWGRPVVLPSLMGEVRFP